MVGDLGYSLVHDLGHPLAVLFSTLVGHSCLGVLGTQTGGKFSLSSLVLAGWDLGP